MAFMFDFSSSSKIPNGFYTVRAHERVIHLRVYKFIFQECNQLTERESYGPRSLYCDGCRPQKPSLLAVRLNRILFQERTASTGGIRPGPNAPLSCKWHRAGEAIKIAVLVERFKQPLRFQFFLLWTEPLMLGITNICCINNDASSLSSFVK